MAGKLVSGAGALQFQLSWPATDASGGAAKETVDATAGGTSALWVSILPVVLKYLHDCVPPMEILLIEGHRTRSRDIDAAVQKEFSRNSDQCSL